VTTGPLIITDLSQGGDGYTPDLEASLLRRFLPRIQSEQPIPATFASGWANYGGGFAPCDFWKDQFGMVHIRGLVTKSGGVPAAGNTIMTLPEGYRPRAPLLFSVISGEPGGIGRVDVNPDGNVLWMVGQTTETDFTSLSGISFRVDA